ncbi:MAG: glucose-1-phosphate adenylyltransferase [Archangium sp.]|nr:glucose-1-phosphate adenylyltransferase [Archangium sp.]MDP3156132.1 glucose-1-phosphate adenylyltransferase [Archangium sp.]MDP3571469.1 glucose-1-phosphate adenylyltransferase [Archangium sp.]
MTARTLAMVLAGGAGTRLEPLTRERAKPAVPFGGRYRIIDFCLSNFVNSGVYKVKVLTQYKSDSLNNHISRTWRMTAFLGHFCETVPAQMRTGGDWYKGSVDAIFQNLNLITDENPDTVFVFGADHVYQMDVAQMLEFHKQRNADATVAVLPVPIEQGSEFGILDVGPDGEVRSFLEKPKNPPPMPGDPTRCLASMGNYIFNTETLVREVVNDAKLENSSHDFGKSILASLNKRARVFAYDFQQNMVPGLGKRERGYWRDVGTLDAYFQANMDLIAVEPIFNLYNSQWPIVTANTSLPPAKFVFNDLPQKRVGRALDSLISEGCIISGGLVERSVLSQRVRVNSWSTVTDSILMENVEIGRHCDIRKAIIDKNVTIPPGTKIGVDLEEDRKRFHVTESGIVVIPKGAHVPAEAT